MEKDVKRHAGRKLEEAEDPCKLAYESVMVKNKPVGKALKSNKACKADMRDEIAVLRAYQDKTRRGLTSVLQEHRDLFIDPFSIALAIGACVVLCTTVLILAGSIGILGYIFIVNLI